MKKTKEPMHDTLDQGEDFEAFEEWEEGKPPEPIDEKAQDIDLPLDEDIPVFEEPPRKDEGRNNLKPTTDDRRRRTEKQGDEGRRAKKQTTPAPEAPQKTVAQNIADELVNLAPEVPVNLVAVIGKTATNVGELIKYRIGDVIDLGRAPGETVDLVANGRLIARGELVEMDGKMGVRILKMVR